MSGLSADEYGQGLIAEVLATAEAEEHHHAAGLHPACSR